MVGEKITSIISTGQREQVEKTARIAARLLDSFIESLPDKELLQLAATIEYRPGQPPMIRFDFQDNIQIYKKDYDTSGFTDAVGELRHKLIDLNSEIGPIKMIPDSRVEMPQPMH